MIILMMVIHIVPVYSANELVYPSNAQSNLYSSLQSRMQTPGHNLRGFTYPQESHIQTNCAYDQRNYGYSSNRNNWHAQGYPQQMRTMHQNY